MSQFSLNLTGLVASQEIPNFFARVEQAKDILEAGGAVSPSQEEAVKAFFSWVSPAPLARSPEEQARDTRVEQAWDDWHDAGCPGDGPPVDLLS